MPIGTINGIPNIANSVEGSAIVIDTFSATAGDKVSFDWDFDQDTHGGSFNDGSFYILKNTLTGDLVTGSIKVGSDDDGNIEVTVPSTGSYQLILGIVDMTNGSHTSKLYVDNVTLHSIENVVSGLTSEVSGNVLDDPMNDPDSTHTWGDTDFVEYGTLLTSVSHDGSPHAVGTGSISFTTFLGGTFEIDEHGEYTYTAPDGINGLQEETFTYTLTDISGDEVTATLTVKVAEDSSFMSETHTSSGSSDTLTGSDVDDVMFGLGGDDVLNGGNGDNYFNGGAGDDSITGGDDADRFDYTSDGDGDDTIFGFDHDGDGDQIDLNALFDSLGIADEDRAADVHLDETAGSTVITIEGVNSFSITLDGVALGDHPGDQTSSELLALGINVGDES